jgi:small-conductance mechanosensitive channel
MKTNKVTDFALTAIALAVGVAVVVLSILKKIDPATGVVLLGIGMGCIGLSLLDTETPLRASRKKPRRKR